MYSAKWLPVVFLLMLAYQLFVTYCLCQKIPSYYAQ